PSPNSVLTSGIGCTSATRPAGDTDRIRGRAAGVAVVTERWSGALLPRSVTSAVPSGRKPTPHGMRKPDATICTAPRAVPGGDGAPVLPAGPRVQLVMLVMLVSMSATAIVWMPRGRGRAGRT